MKLSFELQPQEDKHLIDLFNEVDRHVRPHLSLKNSGRPIGDCFRAADSASFGFSHLKEYMFAARDALDGMRNEVRKAQAQSADVEEALKDALKQRMTEIDRTSETLDEWYAEMHETMLRASE